MIDIAVSFRGGKPELELEIRPSAEALGLSLSEWEKILALPPRSHKEFPSSAALFTAKTHLVKWLNLRRVMLNG